MAKYLVFEIKIAAQLYIIKSKFKTSFDSIVYSMYNCNNFDNKYLAYCLKFKDFIYYIYFYE